MNSKGRLSQNLTVSANKLRLDSLNKILKFNNPSGRKKSNKAHKVGVAGQLSRVALAELLKNSSSLTATSFSSDLGTLTNQTRPPIEVGLPDLKTFLSKPENIETFREFLKTQYCQENLEFYLACEKFRQLDPERVGNDLVKFMATQIYNDFLGEKARSPVNVSYNCLQNITRQMRDPKQNLLIDAQGEIFNLMESDCYPRFCKTWRIDREMAERILYDRPVSQDPIELQQRAPWTPSGNSTSNHLTESSMNTTNHSIQHGSQMNSSYQSSVGSYQPAASRNSFQVGGAKRRRVLQSIRLQHSRGCPPECPYYRIGLPCQQHRRFEDGHDLNEPRTEQRGISDLIDEIDLSRIHHVPDYCARHSPPPPPLPPKLDHSSVRRVGP